MNSEEFLRKVKDYEYVDLKLYDIDGGLRHVTLPSNYVSSGTLTAGVGFDASNFGYTQTSFSDMIAIPDLSMTFDDPFTDSKTLSMLCDVYLPDKTSFSWYPRNVLRKALDYVKESGIATKMIVGPEMEFNIFTSVTHEVSQRGINLEIESDELNWPSMSEPAISMDRGYHRVPPFDSAYDLRNQMTAEDRKSVV